MQLKDYFQDEIKVQRSEWERGIEIRREKGEHEHKDSLNQSTL